MGNFCRFSTSNKDNCSYANKKPSLNSFSSWNGFSGCGRCLFSLKESKRRIDVSMRWAVYSNSRKLSKIYDWDLMERAQLWSEESAKPLAHR